MPRNKLGQESTDIVFFCLAATDSTTFSENVGANPSAKLVDPIRDPSFRRCQQLCQQPCPFLPFSAYFSHLEGAETIEFWSTSGNQ